jgi:hypothetical protein
MRSTVILVKQNSPEPVVDVLVSAFVDILTDKSRAKATQVDLSFGEPLDKR